MKKEVTLILGGGSAYGLAHIGAIAAISEHYAIKAIIGTSMGAIIGAIAACGASHLQMLDMALDLGTRELFNPLNLDFTRSGIFDGRAILKRFEKWTKGTLIEDMKIPFIAVAYDLVSRRTILIDKGKAASAMRASSSLPYIFAPYAWGKYLFVDGGVEHPLPIAFAERFSNKFTIAVNVLPPVSPQAEAINLSPAHSKARLRSHQVFVQSLMHNQSFISIQALLAYPPDIYIDAHDSRYKLINLDKPREFYRYGYEAAGKAIDDFKEPGFKAALFRKYQNLISRRF